MMKKIICLALALLMVLAVFTSCSKDEDTVGNITDEASRSTKSINLWVVTESETMASVSALAIAGLDPLAKEEDLTEEEKAQLAALSDEQKDALSQMLAVSKAINKITKSKLKTQVSIKYLTESEYYTKLEQSFADYDKAVEEAKAAAKAEREALKNGETLAEETEATDETVVNEHGIPELKYPTAAPYQADVFWIGNYEKYRQYADNEWLISLDDKLAESAMQITNYVSQIVTDATRYDGAVYALPNNAAIGEYTYLCVDESEMEALGFNPATATSIYDEYFYNFLSEMRKKFDTTGVYPLYTDNADGKLDLSLVHYWNYDLDSVAGDCLLDPTRFSLYGGVLSNVKEDGSLMTRGDEVSYGNLLSSTVYMEHYLARKAEYESAGYVTNDPNAKAAACVVTGGWDLKAEYEAKGYKVITMVNPRATTDTIYSSMFAIGKSTVDENRAMEVITYLNTNAEVRNLLQHGIENTNYTLSSVVKEVNGVDVEYYYAQETENNLYKMDVRKTGNVFIAYPASAEGIDEIAYSKNQNLDATMYPTLGMYFNLVDYKLDTKSVRIINAVSARVDVYLQKLVSGEVGIMNGGTELKYNEAIVYFARYKARNLSDAQMAALLLEITNNDMTYVEGGETKTFTQEELVSAINCMKTKTIDEKKDAVQSPNALYSNWLSMGGFK